MCAHCVLLLCPTAEPSKSQTRKPKCGKGTHCSRNAYMLVYRLQTREKSLTVEVPGKGEHSWPLHLFSWSTPLLRAVLESPFAIWCRMVTCCHNVGQMQQNLWTSPALGLCKPDNVTSWPAGGILSCGVLWEGVRRR